MRFKARLIGFTVGLLLSGTSASQGQQASLEDRLGEARAAYHLGFTQQNAQWSELGIQSAPALIDSILAEEDLPAEMRSKALRVKTQIAARLGEAASTEALASLPSEIEGIENPVWNQTKEIWRLSALATANQWDEVQEALNQISSEQEFSSESALDYRLLKAKLLIRSSSQMAEGYQLIAESIANDSLWTGIDSFFDPFMGRVEFSAMESLNSWELVKSVLNRLGDSENQIATRRWFELMAPSFDPTVGNFATAPPEDLLQLDATFKTKANVFPPAPDPSTVEAGGYRGLLVYSLFFDDLRCAGRHQDAIASVDALPAVLAGVPDHLWNAYKTGWRAVALTGLLAFADLVQAGAEIEAAAALLPQSENCTMLGSLGVARIRTFDPSGLLTLAPYFLAGPAEPRSRALVRREMLTGLKNLPAQEFLELLHAGGNEPQALAAAAIFATHNVSKFEISARPAILEQAIADGARAIYLQEANRDPAQVELRSAVLPKLASAIEQAVGVEAKAEFLAASGGPVMSNPQLATKLEEISSGSQAPELVQSNSDFDRISTKVASAAGGVILTSVVDSLTQQELSKAARSIPRNYRHRKDVLVAMALYDRIAAIGQSGSGLTTGEWETAQVRRAELMLGDPETAELGITLIRSQAEKVNAEDPAVASAGRQAANALDALRLMTTLEGYLWAIDWVKLIEERGGVPEMKNLLTLISSNLNTAYQLSHVQQLLSSPNLPPNTRNMHRLMIGFSLMRSDLPGQAEPFFSEVAADPSLPRDAELKVIAEGWRTQAWQEIGRTSDSETVRQTNYRKIIDYTRDRLPDHANEGARRRLIQRALWASRQLQDAAAVAEFEPLYAEVRGLPDRSSVNTSGLE